MRLHSNRPPTSTSVFRYYCVAPVSTDSGHTCGLRLDGSVTCWGTDWDGQTLAPWGVDSTFVAVGTGSRHSCAIRDSGKIVCWGSNFYGQDWDFGPAVRLAKEIAQAQGRRLVFESCFPVGPGSLSRRGVPGTTWIPIDQTTYDACRDPRDYRPRKQ